MDSKIELLRNKVDQLVNKEPVHTTVVTKSMIVYCIPLIIFTILLSLSKPKFVKSAKKVSYSKVIVYSLLFTLITDATLFYFRDKWMFLTK